MSASKFADFFAYDPATGCRAFFKDGFPIWKKSTGHLVPDSEPKPNLAHRHVYKLSVGDSKNFSVVDYQKQCDEWYQNSI